MPDNIDQEALKGPLQQTIDDMCAPELPAALERKILTRGMTDPSRVSFRPRAFWFAACAAVAIVMIGAWLGYQWMTGIHSYRPIARESSPSHPSPAPGGWSGVALANANAPDDDGFGTSLRGGEIGGRGRGATRAGVTVSRNGPGGFA